MAGAPITELADMFEAGGDEHGADLFASVEVDDIALEASVEDRLADTATSSLVFQANHDDMVNDINRAMATMGFPHLAFSGNAEDNTVIIDVLRRLMNDRQTCLDDLKQANLELGRITADRDRLKRLVKGQKSELNAMDKKLCRSELLVQHTKTEAERMTKRVKAQNKKLSVENNKLKNMDREYKASMNRKEKELEKIRKAFRGKVHKTKPTIKRGIVMSANLQRADGRQLRWENAVSAEQELLQGARLAYEARLAELDDMLASLAPSEGGDEHAGGSLLTQVVAMVAERAKAAASASVAVPQPSATKETATLHQAKVVALQSQLVSTRTELEEARALIAQQQQVMAERVFASPEPVAAPASHPPSADTLCYIQERDALLEERVELLEAEYQRKHALLDEKAKQVERGRRQLKSAWQAASRESAKKHAVRRVSQLRTRNTPGKETPTAALFHQLEAAVADTPATSFGTTPGIANPTPGTAGSGKFNPRRLQWDNVSPIAATPNHSRKPPTSVRRPKSARKSTSVRRALADVVPNLRHSTVAGGEGSVVEAAQTVAAN